MQGPVALCSQLARVFYGVVQLAPLAIMHWKRHIANKTQIIDTLHSIAITNPGGRYAKSMPQNGQLLKIYIYIQIFHIQLLIYCLCHHFLLQSHKQLRLLMMMLNERRFQSLILLMPLAKDWRASIDKLRLMESIKHWSIFLWDFCVQYWWTKTLFTF